MPLGFVTNDEFEVELEKCKTIPAAPVLIKPIERGRGNGNLEVPESLRKIIGETNQIDGRQSALELAKQFNISPSSVSAYSNGATSCATYNNPTTIKDHINQAKSRISGKAKSKLIAALNNITPEKLAEAKVRDVSGVARDMASIMKDMEPDTVKDSSEVNKPQFIIYSPQIREENHFNVIQVSE